MTTKEAMLEILYKALADGVSKLIKNGLAFTVMTGVIIGLCWWTLNEMNVHAADRREWKIEIIEIKTEYRDEMNRLRVEIYECNNSRSQLAARVAELEATVKYKIR